MKESLSMYDGLLQSWDNILINAQAYLPKILATVLLLVVGWLVAKAARIMVIWSIEKLDFFWRRIISRKSSVKLQPRQAPARIVGELVFWLFILISITLATDILGLSIFAVWLKQLLTYLPLAIAGLFIVLAGFVLSSLARDLIVSAAITAGLGHGDLLARTVQVMILLMAIILGVDQIGIDIMFLSVISGVVLSALLGGIALAFGLGARIHVSNILASNQLQQIYQVGDLIRVGDIEGRIVEIMISRVIIETDTGTVDIPAKIFDEQVTTILEKGS